MPRETSFNNRRHRSLAACVFVSHKVEAATITRRGGTLGHRHPPAINQDGGVRTDLSPPVAHATPILFVVGDCVRLQAEGQQLGL